MINLAIIILRKPALSKIDAELAGIIKEAAKYFGIKVIDHPNCNGAGVLQLC